MFSCGCGDKNLIMSGNGDYEYKISNQWSIFRNNSFDIMIGKSNRLLPYTPEKMKIGPLFEYSLNGDTIFGKHYGQKKRNLFKNDELLESDSKIIVVVEINTINESVKIINDLTILPRNLKWIPIP